ncbi:MAG: flavodoxin domain-containing protein [Methanobacterium sp.]
MQKTLIIYESKYGTTEKIARHLSQVLGPARHSRTSQVQKSEEYDFVVIGTPIYSGNPHHEICEFIEDNLDWLKSKPVAIFCTCLSPEDGEENLNRLEEIIGNIISKKYLGGILKQGKLSDEDKKALEIFSKKVGFQLQDMDNFDLEKVLDYALELKSIKEELMPQAPSNMIKETIEEFLKAHNTCTLSTSYKNRVRSTPIEYNYNEGFIYLLSEGGEKFSNLPLNENVSVAVYEDYTGMNDLAGMQITGTAYIIPGDSDEYEDIIKMKGLNMNFIKNYPVNMNIIKIELQRIEFLYSEFKKSGYEPKQIYKFK